MKFAPLLGLVLCAAIGGCGGDSDERADCSEPFDAQEWHRAQQLRRGNVDAEPSHRLAEALAECGTLTDRGKAHVRRLLGGPRTLSTLRSTARSWYYPLGELGNSFNDDYLEIRFDGRGRVVRANMLLDFG